MKKITKRGLSCILAAIMSVSVLSGCGGKKNEDVTTITVWTNSTHTKDVMTKLIADFNESEGKQEGIRIDYVVQGGDYQKVLDVSIQAKELPELYYPITNIQNYVKLNAMTPIEDMPGGEEFIKKYEGKLVEYSNTYEGKTYTVPYNLTTLGLLYNKDLFKKNGIVDENGEAKAPTTWNEIREYAKKCTNLDAKEYGIALPLKWSGYTNWDLLMPFFSVTGSVGWDPVKGEYDYQKLTPAFEWFKQIKEDASYYIGAEGLDNDPARAQFAEGNIAMKLGASWDCGVLNDQFPAKCDWGVAPIPGLDGAPKYLQNCSTDPFLAISSNIPEEKKEKVMKVFEWFHNDEVVSTLYKAGKIIPADSNIIENTTIDDAPKGWDEFCNLAKISLKAPNAPSIKLEGASVADVVMKVWMGEVEISNALLDLTTRSNDALKKDVDAGKINLDSYKLENMDNYLRAE